MFLAQDGVVLATTLRALTELEILEAVAGGESGRWRICEPEMTEAGFGALRVAVHGLAVDRVADRAADPRPPEHPPSLDRRRSPGDGPRERYVALGEFLAGFASTDDDAWARPWGPAQVEGFRALVAGRQLDRTFPATSRS